MAEDKIDSIIDRAAVTAEVEALKKQIGDIASLIKQTKGQSIDFNVNTKTIADYNTKVAELNTSMQKVQQSVSAVTLQTVKNTQATQQANGTLEQNVELRRRLQTSLDSYNKSQKEDLALLKAGTITRAEYNKRITESQTKIAVYKQRIQELNRVIKEDVALEGRAGDAYKQLSAEYNRAALAAKNYQITLGATHPATVAAVNNAKRLSDELKTVDAAVGQNQRNVGNYAGGITQAFGKLWGFLRTAANVIPGLGIGGLIGGIVVALGQFGAGIININKSFNEGKAFAKAYAETLETVREESIKAANVDTTKLELYRTIITDTTRSQKDRTEALKAYNSIADESNQIDVAQINNLTLVNDQISQQIALIEKRTFSRAAENILVSKSEALLLAKESARTKAEKQFEIEAANGQIVIAEAYDKRTKSFVKNSEEFLALERTRVINGKIARDTTVKNAQIEFDAAKKALYDLIQVEGFAAEEVKKTKEKKARKTKDIAEAERKAQFEILKANLELDKEYDLLRANDQRKSFVDRTANLISYGADSQKLIEAQAAFDLGAANLTATERLKIENDKNNALIRLATELNEKLKNLTRDSFKVDTSSLPRDGKIPKELQQILDNFDKAQKEAIKKAAENARKLKDAFREAFKDLATEATGLFFDLFQNPLEKEKNEIQDRIDLIEEQKRKDIELTNQTVTNAAQRADQVVAIEIRADAERRRLEQRQRQLDQRKAAFDKANAVAGIIQNTSLAIIKVLAQFPGPPGIALAAVIGSLGAIQLYRTLAQPIPRYAEGTENHPGGLMYVGDGGRSEGMKLPDGSIYKTPATTTLVDAPAGTKVYKDYSKMLLDSTMTSPPVFNIKAQSNTVELRKGFNDVVRAVKAIPQPILKSEGNWSRSMREGSSFRNYVNKNL